jgi:hypothetical protein
MDTKKFVHEIKWYSKVPKRLSTLAPRILDYSLSRKPFVSMEYIGYPSLSELWLYGDINVPIWKSILKRLMSIVSLLMEDKKYVSKEDYYNMYIKKTNQRVRKLTSTSQRLRELLGYKSIIINGSKYKNWNLVKGDVFEHVQKMYDSKDNCFIHGDLCFSNILYDTKNGIFKFVDPRGKWGSNIYGDVKYDIAKLRHSISGKYDFIINNLFNISVLGNNISLKVFSDPHHSEIENFFDELISNYWKLTHIKLIEGLLFMSMLPLHNDNEKRQIALYSTGIAKLNEAVNILS